MARKKTGNVIGFDPLAWMKNTSRESRVASRESTEGNRESGVVSRESKAKEAVPPTQHSALSTHDSIRLGESLTIDHARSLHESLAPLLDKREVVLDAGGVGRVDTAGLQVLAAFVRALEGRGAAVRWRAPTEALQQGARRLDVAGILRLP
jgi:anti-anti-sigma regulatory factor